VLIIGGLGTHYRGTRCPGYRGQVPTLRGQVPIIGGQVPITEGSVAHCRGSARPTLEVKHIMLTCTLAITRL